MKSILSISKTELNLAPSFKGLFHVRFLHVPKSILMPTLISQGRTRADLKQKLVDNCVEHCGL